MEVQLNTLYLMARGAVLRREHLTLRVEVERQVRLSVPIHQLESVAAFGGVHVTAAALALCAERGVAVSYLTESLSQSIGYDLRTRLYSHLQELSLAYYDTTRVGTILSTLTSDVQTIQSMKISEFDV